MVCSNFPLFTQVTRVPTFTRIRYGVNSNSLRSHRAPAFQILTRSRVVVSTVSVSVIGPSNMGSEGGGGIIGAVWDASDPFSLNASTLGPRDTPIYCSPLIWYEIAAPPRPPPNPVWNCQTTPPVFASYAW